MSHEPANFGVRQIELQIFEKVKKIESTLQI